MTELNYLAIVAGALVAFMAAGSYYAIVSKQFEKLSSARPICGPGYSPWGSPSISLLPSSLLGSPQASESRPGIARCFSHGGTVQVTLQPDAFAAPPNTPARCRSLLAERVIACSETSGRCTQSVVVIDC